MADIKAKGGEATFVLADISAEEDAKNLVEKTVEFYAKSIVLSTMLELPPKQVAWPISAQKSFRRCSR